MRLDLESVDLRLAARPGKAWIIRVVPDQIITALGRGPKPGAVQCLANPLDSAGELHYFEGPARPREVIATAQANGVGVMGIRVFWKHERQFADLIR